ncbi:type II toxin-antitoxin system RelE/ParE family toxin [Enterobacter sp.]|uniref:type II toxin-antitoxin system RelE/ParE family toxin n=1 Tax=Enterobacter sp. TaxID=42895 RepID=UPI00296E7CE1|nr:type II toxin-antitoxin system RelE/ParE family toxin [Enterobacter sp.]
MAIYMTKGFKKDIKKLPIGNEALKTAAQEVVAGNFEADLGGGVIKKRLSLNKGKSGGVRSVIFFKAGSNLFLFECWMKASLKTKGAKEISDIELAAMKRFAGTYFNLSPEKIAEMVTAGLLQEVK